MLSCDTCLLSPHPRGLRQEDHKFKASLGNTERLYLKTTTNHSLNLFQITSCSNKSIKIIIYKQVSKATSLWSALVLHEWLGLCSDILSFEISCQWILCSPTQLCVSSIGKKKPVSTILPNVKYSLPYSYDIQYRIHSLVL